jgi:hypothetical protein
MPDYFKPRVIQKMSYVLTPARKEIIEADNFIAVGNKAFAKVRTDESRTASNQYSHLTLILQFLGSIWPILAESAEIRTAARHAGILLNGNF